MPDTHSISFEGSKYCWGDVDFYWKESGFKERSKFIQTVVERVIDRKKSIRDFLTVEVFFLFLLAIIMLLLSLIYMRV